MATGTRFEEEAIGIYKAHQFGNPIGFGDRPAVIVVDFFNACTDPAILGGGNIGEAVERTARLLPQARAAGCPVIYATMTFREDLSDAGWMGVKVPSVKVYQAGTRAVEIDSRVARQPQDYLIVKKAPSVFFGTTLNMLLTYLRADTLIVTGCTTSGCVRATVVDAFSAGYRVIVPRECVGDRASGPHDASLFDMDQKYGDVLPSEEVATYLASVVGGQRRAGAGAR